MSLRARLLILVLLGTMLPALVMGWRFFRDSEIEIEAALKGFATSADGIAQDLDHRVQGTAQLHFGLAPAQVLGTADREACSAYLSSVREAYPQTSSAL